MTRDQLLHLLSATLCSLPSRQTLRVALDGIDAAGKTTLADELAPLIEAQGRPVIRASIDGFHQPRSVRLQRGPLSPEGYYEDSFEYATLRAVLLDPLGPQGNGFYQRAAFDFRTDTPLVTPSQEAPPNAVLLFDGVFLLRPELVHLWDYRIFIYVKMERALQRALRRDLSLFGSEDVIQTRYLRRYQPGQRLYYQIANPHEQANILIDNNDPSSPQVFFPSQAVNLPALEP
jgi:uridine kinase